MRFIFPLFLAFSTFLPPAQVAPRLYMIDSGITGLIDVTYGPDYLGGNGEDCAGHGTEVAKTARSITYAPITSVKVLGCDGFGHTTDIRLGMQWVWDDFKAKGYAPAVVVMALNSNEPNNDWDAIITNATIDGLTWVVPAGNTGTWAFLASPQRVDVAIVAGGAYGSIPASYSNYGPSLDLWAQADTPTNWHGTSFAAARLAGAAIKVLKSYPWAPPAHIRTILVDSAGTITGPDIPGTTRKRFISWP